MILKSYDLDKWVTKYFISKMKHIEILKKRRKDTEKCTIQYLFSMSVSFPYHFSIFSVSEFFIGLSSFFTRRAFSLESTIVNMKFLYCLGVLYFSWISMVSL